ncbi:serine hydrolase family protein [Sediminibacillus dalangtanensis]|uniref:Serine hydrolase family protein n=1 Tax=Sediminibacillus dalangtanensis TaxID=2729421 RepID=A0ABX7VRR0_9BACI|nr:alpha/beta fold hydrolase [Sediminibacillus dalangtanensis]QTM98255.1 serine hydrolase family protein [Sediminibacillus dalangtanensis]
MKKTVLFVHSAGPQGQDQGSGNLSSYLNKELGDNYNVVSPEMPEPENPVYAFWKNQLEKELHKLTGDVILIGHSLGGSVLLKYLTEHSCHLHFSGLFIIASPYWGLEENWRSKEFTLQPNFEQKLPAIPNLFLYHSVDEDIVPFAHHLAYAEKLPQATTRELEGKQHLFLHGLPTLVQDIEGLEAAR